LVRELLRSGADARGGAILSTDPQPWKQATAAVTNKNEKPAGYRSEPIPEPELAAIATESSQAERRADDAERELMEWKKMRFMEDRVGEDFGGIILSCTKYGFFVELDDMFIEGLVPITLLSGWGSDERFVFRDTDKQIVSTRTGRGFKMGQRVHVLLDRIDRQQRRLQFALVPEAEAAGSKSLRQGNAARADAPTGGDRRAKHAKAKPAKRGRVKAGGKKGKGKRR
jgi:ribonuclease R